ncbi:immortalization up-regulated protein isoform X3 [Tamandua tetradactyla]|uniref:immortalization up-regulated protein isoform X3 n=1 Tax=Tamandua tetradactyla TaxID=48850 RepID=UPI0040544692
MEFNLSAALATTSKKPAGAGQEGDPKHSSHNVAGAAANLRVSHFNTSRGKKAQELLLIPGPCRALGFQPGGDGLGKGPPGLTVTPSTSRVTAAPQTPGAAPATQSRNLRPHSPILRDQSSMDVRPRPRSPK